VTPRKAKDLSRVRARLEEVFTATVAEVWLHSPNAFLGGARPLDVLLIEGLTPVLAAIDATAAGSYA